MKIDWDKWADEDEDTGAGNGSGGECDFFMLLCELLLRHLLCRECELSKRKPCFYFLRSSRF